MIRSEDRQTNTEPDDAHRGWVAATAADADEARAIRAMADAERAVAEGTATDDQRTDVERMAGARTHEERRAAYREN